MGVCDSDGGGAFSRGAARARTVEEEQGDHDTRSVTFTTNGQLMQTIYSPDAVKDAGKMPNLCLIEDKLCLWSLWLLPHRSRRG